MPPPKCYAITPQKERKIKIAAEGRCELCQEQFGLSNLRLHHLPDADCADLQRNILILCQLCHIHIHALPVPAEQQRKWVERRPIKTRKLIREIMGYRLKSYSPPEAQDMAAIFAEAACSWVLNGSG